MIRMKVGAKEWDPSRTEKQCAYCSEQLSSRNRSKEDYWPSWLQKNFPHSVGERSSHFTRGSGRKDEIKESGRLGIRGKVRFLCRKCNNEFGSEIQQAAKPAISKALSSAFSSLNNADLQALAKWALMFAMTYEFVDYPSKRISQIERERFRCSSDVSSTFSIWLGRYGGSGFQLGQQHLQGDSTFLSGEQMLLNSSQTVTTIALGQIFLIVYSFERFGPGALNLPKEVRFRPPPRGAWAELIDALNTERGWVLSEFAPISDTDLQNLALEPFSADAQGQFRRIDDNPTMDRNFWRRGTSEPLWNADPPI